MHSLSASFRTPARGSAMITVLLFLFLILTLTASVLQWSLSERRMNVRAAYWLEARNAAEAVAEYGFSQIATQFSRYASPPSFNPAGSSPLVQPPASFFAGSNINVTSVELIGGAPINVPSNGLFYVDPADPANQFETIARQNVYRRDVQVLAKVTVQPPGGGPSITAYVTEKCSVRGAPLFANAIFYGRYDLEVFPGPVFNIYGPVHTNGNMFVSSQGNSLNFYGPVSASGNLYHAWANEQTASQGTGNEALGTSPVTFLTAAGTQVEMKDSAGVWHDSTNGTDSSLWNSSGHYTDTSTAAITQLQGKLSSTFRQYASQTWGGNVQTAAMGVQSYNPVSFSEPIDSSGTLPDPHTLIDPPATSTYLNSDSTYTAAKTEVEKQKYSNQAALYVKVTVAPGASGTPDTAVVEYYSWPGSDPKTTPDFPTATGNRLKIGQVSYDASGTATTSNEPGIVKFVPYKASATGGTATQSVNKVIYTATGSGSSWKIKTATTSNMTATYSSSIVNYGATTTGVTPAAGVTPTYAGGTSGSATGSTVYATQTDANNAISTQYGTTAGSTNYLANTALSASPTGSVNVSQGVYDQRQDAGVNLVQVDTSALNAAMTTMANNTKSTASIVDNSSTSKPLWGPGVSGGFSLASAGSTGWNGAVYVEVKTSDGSATQTSVAMTNGQVASSSTSLLPTVNGDSNGYNLGLTVATNAPMYVVGNFNSTGTNATVTGQNGAATTPDDTYTNAAGTTRSSEIPVALAADAITLLSPNYFGTSSTSYANTLPNNSGAPVQNPSGSSAYASYSQTSVPTATTINSVAGTEVAAAFITGLVQTSAASSSGGVHNLPRFLEDWSSKTVTIRGSLVSLYLSKVATAQWHSSSSFYSPPTRNWGFDKIFQNGTFPPLTPKVISYRRTQFSSMSAADYAAAKHTLWPSLY